MYLSHSRLIISFNQFGHSPLIFSKQQSEFFCLLLCLKVPGDQHFLKYLNQLFWYQRPSTSWCGKSHGKSHLDFALAPFWCMMWTRTEALDLPQHDWLTGTLFRTKWTVSGFQPWDLMQITNPSATWHQWLVNNLYQFPSFLQLDLGAINSSRVVGRLCRQRFIVWADSCGWWIGMSLQAHRRRRGGHSQA